VPAELDWVVFDLNGTLLDPAALSAVLPPPCHDERTGVDLLDATVHQSMVDTLAGQHRPFAEYLRASVRQVLDVAGLAEDQHVEAVVAAASRMPAFPEVPGALAALSEAGLRLAAVTNSTTATAESCLEFAGIRGHFEVVTGSDYPRAYKPAPQVYRTGLERIGTAPPRACMVAAHGWDVHGAKAVGMRTGWVARKERALLGTVSEPDFRGGDVAEVCRKIAAWSITWR
jgi:2-haloacid dehalogenase